MGFIKGPKQLLSSAIVNALEKYFILDLSQIESKLLGDARIVLKDVELRPVESTVVAENTTGESSTIMFVTGSVKEVIFSWRWTTDKKSKTWVEDVNLTIRGADFQVKLKHGPLEVNKQSGSSSTSIASSSSSSSSDLLPDEKTISNDTKAEAKREGGIQSYVRRHVEAMIDALTLRLENFKIVVDAPDSEGGTTSIAFGGESAVIESHGRAAHGSTGNAEEGVVGGISNLKQTLSLCGLYAAILLEDGERKEGDNDGVSGEESLGEGATSVPLLEPFYCEADMIRAGKRFQSFSRGLRAVLKSGPAGLVLHAGHEQSYALAQFSVMMLSVKDKEGNADFETKANGLTTLKSETMTVDASDETAPPGFAVPPEQAFPSKRPSVFDLKLATMAVVLNKQRFQVSNFTVSYIADGSKLTFEADECTMTNDVQIEGEGCSVLIKGIHGSKSPELEVKADLIERIVTPSVKLLSPSKDTRLAFEGDTLTIKMHKLQCAFLTDESVSHKDETVLLENSPQKQHPNAQAPFPIDLFIEEFGVQQNDDPESRMQFTGVEVLANPTCQGTDVAAYIAGFRKHFKREDSFCLKITTIVLQARWPMVGSKLVENFKLAAKKTEISEAQWANVFELQEEKGASQRMREGDNHALVLTKKVDSDLANVKEEIRQKASAKKKSEKTIWRLPNAEIDTLKIHISMKISHLKAVSLTNVAFQAKPFKGNDKTTSKDLIDYYLAVCLKQLPEFASKTEIVGIKTMDLGTNTYGTILGMSTPFGAIGSVAVMAGADAIKGTVAAGKKARCADETDSMRPMDLIRGIGYAAADASRKGALRRGKIDGEGLDIIDWVVGASTDTGKYVEENKARLGGAGGAGAGMMVGFMIAGPVGGIIGGVIGGVTTQKTIEAFDGKKEEATHDDKQKQKGKKKEDGKK